MSETEYVLVPKVPTDRMLEQAAFNLSADFGPEFVMANEAFARAVWSEFVDASPAPAASRGKDTLDYEGAIADLESALEVLVRRINGERDLPTAAEWLALNYPVFALKNLLPHVRADLPKDIRKKLAALPDAPVPAKDGEVEG